MDSPARVRAFPAASQNRFSSDNQPDHAARGEKVRATNLVRQALANAADKLGNEAMFLEMWRGNPAYKQLPPTLAAKLLAEDRRCFLNIYAKLLPIEVQGSLDATLTVRVVTQLEALQDAAPLPALPTAGVDRAPAG